MELIAEYCPDCVTIVEQRHGDCVCPAVGHPHAVWNLRPNLKLAFDSLHPKHLAAAVLSRDTIAVPYFGACMAPDYASVLAKVGRYFRSVGYPIGV
jgi:hypothetical protein